MELVVASSNTHKIDEFAQILTDFSLVPMKKIYSGEIEESGSTFKENAYIKAKFICDKFGVAAIADDSGLCVDCLGGEPGVYSSRYSGGGDRENRLLLLKNLENAKERTAHFKSVICICFPDGKVVFGEGQCDGKILLEEDGDGGFGYDTIFFSDDLKKSFGRATAEEKNSVSHRYRALCDLRAKL